MKEVAMLGTAEPREILQAVIGKKVPAIMSYLSRGKWHVAKVLLIDLGACRLNAEVLPTKRPHPINIRPDQPVGISVKYGYGKFIFESKVVALEPSSDGTSGGTIALEVPDRIEIVQRRSYFRVEVPESLKVNVLLWHRGQRNMDSERMDSERDEGQLDTGGGGQAPAGHYWQGRLIDISAGGAQIAIDFAQGQDFRNGQFIGVRFTPMPYETPLMFSAQIRNILPTADGKSFCLGVQTVGLEASPEGREVLQRLCGVVERYYQIKQSSVKQQDFHGAPA
ncbi:MAG: flagellar brake protein [Planctomycetota bacterium]